MELEALACIVVVGSYLMVIGLDLQAAEKVRGRVRGRMTDLVST